MVEGALIPELVFVQGNSAMGLYKAAKGWEGVETLKWNCGLPGLDPA